MSLFIGSTAAKVYVGANPATAVYVGGTKVWQAGSPVAYRSAQEWPGLAYNPGQDWQIQVAHQPGDVLVMFVSDYSWTTGATIQKTANSPTWTMLQSVAAQGAIFWAKATRSDHTTGICEGTGTWYATLAVFSGSKAANPIGGSAFIKYDAPTSIQAPGITLADTSGNSQIMHAYHCYSGGTAYVTNGAAGYTNRLTAPWTAPNSSTHFFGLSTKDVTTSDGVVTLATTNGGIGYVHACTVEIVGG